MFREADRTVSVSRRKSDLRVDEESDFKHTQSSSVRPCMILDMHHAIST
eukprot:COSAG04_NODE_26183_length_298_cov_0.783920_2_plen_48_part_01